MILLDSLLWSGLRFVLGRIAQAADAEVDETEHLREQLLAARMRLELGEIGEHEYARLEKAVLRRMRQAARGRGRGRGERVTGVEVRTWDDE